MSDIDKLNLALANVRNAIEALLKVLNEYLATTKPATLVNIEAVSEKFPEDLVDMLYFEENEEYVLIRPRQYLGSENFAKIAAIVRDQLGGEYIQAGKESHFRVSKGAIEKEENEAPEFDPEDLMKHEWKAKKTGDKEYTKGTLSWGWDFSGEFNEATLKVLEKGPLELDGYTFTLTDKGTVKTQKTKK